MSCDWTSHVVLTLGIGGCLPPNPLLTFILTMATLAYYMFHVVWYRVDGHLAGNNIPCCGIVWKCITIFTENHHYLYFVHSLLNAACTFTSNFPEICCNTIHLDAWVSCPLFLKISFFLCVLFTLLFCFRNTRMFTHYIRFSPMEKAQSPSDWQLDLPRL